MMAASSGAAVHSEAYSNPSETNVEAGRQQLNACLRSIVMSRSAFLLFHGFHPAADNVVSIGDLAEGASSKNTPRPDFTNSKENEGLLEDCLGISSLETEITKALGKRLHATLKNLTTIAEAKVTDESNSKKNPPRLDIAHGERENGSLVGFVEVGLTPKETALESEPEKLDQLFWKKVHQAINYLRLLSRNDAEGDDEEGRRFKFSVKDTKTVLVCVIVTTRSRKSGRIAVFACERNGDNSWRMARYCGDRKVRRRKYRKRLSSTLIPSSTWLRTGLI
jgi:hypothetical protein